VPWWTYVALRDALDQEHGSVRMTYLEGMLELMSPSTLHEDAKKIIARLLEVWATELDIDLRGFGNATFRAEAKRGGLEPDECYRLGKLNEGDVPDLAIEVEISSPLVDKLEVYRRLGVREVWIWRDGAIEVHCASGPGYARESHSQVLPALDVIELGRFVVPGESQTKLARAYRDALRNRAM
jgi:Uma2 family endonuclease